MVGHHHVGTQDSRAVDAGVLQVCVERRQRRGGLAGQVERLVGRSRHGIEQPAAAVANEYYVAAINRVGIEDLGDDDFYGQSYFIDPEGQYVGEKGDPYLPELIVRDLDLDLITTVRNRWAFYRDRRPEAYDDLVRR